MKRFTYCLNLIFILIGSIQSNAQERLTKETLNKRLTYFYQQADSNSLKDILFTLRTDRQLRESFPPTAFIGFCTGILLSQSANSKVVAGELEKHKQDSKMFEFILTLGQTKDTLRNWREHSAEVNDMMWSAYFGTGDTKYLDRLLSETQFIEREDSLNLMLAAGSAMWSLSSNARQHPSIGEYLRAKIPTVDDKTKTVLNEILNRDPGYFREQMVARIKDMKSRGLLPDVQKPEPYVPKFIKKPNGGLIGFSGPTQSFSIELEAKELRPTSDPSYYNVDGKFLQATTVQVPPNFDWQNATPGSERGILNGYVAYEISYFEKDLKLTITDPAIDFETINKKLFVKWSFVAQPQTQVGTNVTPPKRHIYYSTVCFDRVLSLSSVIIPNENVKAPESMLKAITKTLKLYDNVVKFD
jgi:hypothetical protein